MENNEKENNKQKWKLCLQTFMKVAFSHIGTFLMVITYIIMGGFLFKYLEENNEILVCKEKYHKYSTKLNESIQRIMAISTSRQENTQIMSELETTMTMFSKDVFKINYEPSKNCSTIGQPGNLAQWNIYNSIFFCVTIITTIGYGNITPLTDWGKINSMIYSIFGIPLMLLFLTNVGEIMATFFRFIYLNLCCCRCFISRRAELVDLSTENDTKLNKEGQPPPKVNVGNQLEYEMDDDDNVFVVIPITVVLIVLFIYIIVGACLFRIWEQEWSMVDGTYFSYITLATIGFGDFVPGKDGFEKAETGTELIVGGMYCLLGLAILSMCLNLIQDEIASKFRWLGNKLGLIDDSEYLDKDELVDNAEPFSYSTSQLKENQMTVIQRNFNENGSPQMFIKQTDC